MGPRRAIVDEVNEYHKWLQESPASDSRWVLTLKETDALSEAYKSILRSLLQQGEDNIKDEARATLVVSGIATVAQMDSMGCKALKSDPRCVPILEALITAHPQCDAIISHGIWALCCLDLEVMMRVCQNEKMKAAGDSIHRAVIWALSMMPSVREQTGYETPSWGVRLFLAQTATDYLRRNPPETWEEETTLHCLDAIGHMMKSKLPDTDLAKAAEFIEITIGITEIMPHTELLHRVSSWTLVKICDGNQAAIKRLESYREKISAGLAESTDDSTIRAFSILCRYVGRIPGIQELLGNMLAWPRAIDALLYVLIEMDEPIDCLLPELIEIIKGYDEYQPASRTAVKVVGRMCEWTKNTEVATQCIKLLKEAANGRTYDVKCEGFDQLSIIAEIYPDQCRIKIDVSQDCGRVLTLKLRLMGKLYGADKIIEFCEEGDNEEDLWNRKIQSSCFALEQLGYSDDDTTLSQHADRILEFLIRILDKYSFPETLKMCTILASISAIGIVAAYCTIQYERGLAHIIQLSTAHGRSDSGLKLIAATNAALIKVLRTKGSSAAHILKNLDTDKLMVQWITDYPDHLEIQSEAQLILGMVLQNPNGTFEAMNKFSNLGVQAGGCKAITDLFRLGYQYTDKEQTWGVSLIARAANLPECAGNEVYHTHAATAYGALTCVM